MLSACRSHSSQLVNRVRHDNRPRSSQRSGWDYTTAAPRPNAKKKKSTRRKVHRDVHRDGRGSRGAASMLALTLPDFSFPHGRQTAGLRSEVSRWLSPAEPPRMPRHSEFDGNREHERFSLYLRPVDADGQPLQASGPDSTESLRRWGGMHATLCSFAPHHGSGAAVTHRTAPDAAIELLSAAAVSGISSAGVSKLASSAWRLSPHATLPASETGSLLLLPTRGGKSDGSLPRLGLSSRPAAPPSHTRPASSRGLRGAGRDQRRRRRRQTRQRAARRVAARQYRVSESSPWDAGPPSPLRIPFQRTPPRGQTPGASPHHTHPQRAPPTWTHGGPPTAIP